MRSNAPPLSPTFRSRLQGDLLALVLLRPDREWTVTELADQLQASLSSVQSEVGRLVTGNVLLSRKVGRSRVVRANTKNPAVPPLTQLTLVSFGPQTVIAAEFADVQADRVVIYGSWAARYHGEVGSSPNDIDVLVVGNSLDRPAVYQAAERAEERLGMPVDAVLRGSRAWAEPSSDPLVDQIVRRPYIELVGGGE